MELCQKQNKFFEFVAAFSKARLNFEHLEKNITLTADVLPILRAPKNMVKQISTESIFRGPFENQHAKGYQTLCQFERHQL